MSATLEEARVMMEVMLQANRDAMSEMLRDEGVRTDADKFDKRVDGQVLGICSEQSCRQ